MSYSVFVSFSGPAGAPVYSLSDVISVNDWTYAHYWDDIASLVSSLISDGESMLDTLYPSGHNYSLSEVKVSPLEVAEE